MSRIGKIARLPGIIREQLNQRLQDGHNGPDILAWLNSTDEVKAVLASHFSGREITDGNLSDWRSGGFRDWERNQSILAETDRVIGEGLDLENVGGKGLTEKLAVWMLGRYMGVTRKLVENQDDPAAWKLLREICHDLVALRRGDHLAEWLRIDREKLDIYRLREERHKKSADGKAGASAEPPMTDEEKDAAWRQIFGMPPREDDI